MNQDQGSLAVQLLKNVIKITFFVLSKTLGVVATLLQFAGKRLDGEYQKERARNRSMAHAVEREVKERQDHVSPVQTEDFKAADRIITVRLDPPVGVIHLRLFQAEGVMKREIVIQEPKLRALLQGRRHELPDAKVTPGSGYEDIKLESVKLAENLINTKGNLKLRESKPAVAETAKPKVVVKEVNPPMEARQPQRVEPPPPPPAPPAPREESAPVAPQAPAYRERAAQSSAPVTQAYVPSVEVGVAFEGELVSAGSQRVTPHNRPAYEVFEARVLVGGVEVPLRGAELEREIDRLGIQAGDHVSITPMGKVPVTLADGRQGSKNVYRVLRLEGGVQ